MATPSEKAIEEIQNKIKEVLYGPLMDEFNRDCDEGIEQNIEYNSASKFLLIKWKLTLLQALEIK